MFDLSFLADIEWQVVEQGFCFLYISCLQHQAGQFDGQGVIIRITVPGLLQVIAGRADFTVLQCFHGLFIERVGGPLYVFFKHGPDFRFRLYTHEFIDDAAVFEQLHGRQTANTKLLRQCLLGIGIDLGQHDPAVIIVDDFFQQGHQHPAGRTPGGPEIDQHRDMCRALQYLFFKTVTVDCANDRGFVTHVSCPFALYAGFTARCSGAGASSWLFYYIMKRISALRGDFFTVPGLFAILFPAVSCPGPTRDGLHGCGVTGYAD